MALIYVRDVARALVKAFVIPEGPSTKTSTIPKPQNSAKTLYSIVFAPKSLK